MLKMQEFYKLLTPTSKTTDSYFKVTKLLTKANCTQMSALESDLNWQEWGAEKAA